MIQVVVIFCNSGMSNLNKAFKWLVHGYVIWMLQSISSQFSGGSIPVDLGSLVGMWWWRVVNSRTTPQRACHSGHTLVVSKWLPNLSSCRPQLLRFICPRSQHQNKTKINQVWHLVCTSERIWTPHLVLTIHHKPNLEPQHWPTWAPGLNSNIELFESNLVKQPINNAKARWNLPTRPMC